MKVTGTKVNDSEIYSEIDLELDGLPKSIKPRVKRDVGEFLVEQTLLSLGEAKTPVQGAGYKKSLSKDYRKFKVGSNRSGVADLEFDGDMKDSFVFRLGDGDKIKLGHFKSSEARKADGHNNFSGESDLPERRYLPKDGEKYKRGIQSEIDRIVADAFIDARPISESKLQRVESKGQFWDLLKSSYTGLSRGEIVSAVSRNDDFFDLLKTMGLIKWLK